MQADATHVLVQVAGGPGLTLSEVEILMQELGRHVSEQTQILFGAAVDGRLGDRLSVTIISSLAAEDEAGVISTPSVFSTASVAALKKVNRQLSKAKISTSRPICERTSR